MMSDEWQGREFRYKWQMGLHGQHVMESHLTKQ